MTDACRLVVGIRPGLTDRLCCLCQVHFTQDVRYEQLDCDEHGIDGRYVIPFLPQGSEGGRSRWNVVIGVQEADGL